MKYIITGPTGSIGINLIIELMENPENEIWAICNPNSNRADLIPKSNNIHIVFCDISNLSSLSNICKEIDVFIHYAWLGTTGDGRKDIDLQLSNVQYCFDALRLAKNLNCKTFIGAGSQAEYGRKNHAIREDELCLPENAYGIGKLSAYHFAEYFCKENDIRFLWLRFFSVYGPYENFTSLTSTTLIKYLNNQVPDFTEGIQIWDYSYAKDVSHATILLITKKSSGVFNISSGKPRQLKEFIKVMSEICGISSPGNFGAISYTPNQVMYLCADTNKLTNEISYELNTPFEEGIKETLDWLRSMLKERI